MVRILGCCWLWLAIYVYVYMTEDKNPSPYFLNLFPLLLICSGPLVTLPFFFFIQKYFLICFYKQTTPTLPFFYILIILQGLSYHKAFTLPLPLCLVISSFFLNQSLGGRGPETGYSKVRFSRNLEMGVI